MKNAKFVLTLIALAVIFGSGMLFGGALADVDQARWNTADGDVTGTLLDAVEAANTTPGTTITLLKDIGKADFPDNTDTREYSYKGDKLPFRFSGTDTTLDLAGHTIDREQSPRVFYGDVINVTSGASLTITGNGVITGGNNFGISTVPGSPDNEKYYNGGGISVYGGTLTIESGTITGNESSNGGGGIYVYDGTLTLESGTITGNKTDVAGGGIYVKQSGSLTMNGGRITGNIATSDLNLAEPYGGGVSVGAKSSFTMTSGVISGNEAKCGGGVNVSSGTATISGGVISGNKATGDSDNQGGGGIYQDDSIVTISGTARIADNTSACYGGGVYADSVVNDQKLNISGGTITGNTATNGGGVYVSGSGPLNFTGGSITYNSAINGGGVQNMGQTSTISGTARIAYNTATGSEINTGVGGGVYNGGKLTISGNARITGNTASNYGGGVYNGNTYVFHPYTVITVSGSPKITGNEGKDGADDVYLMAGYSYSGKPTLAAITIKESEPLSPGASIGVRTQTTPKTDNDDPVLIATVAKNSTAANYLIPNDATCYAYYEDYKDDALGGVIKIKPGTVEAVWQAEGGYEQRGTLVAAVEYVNLSDNPKTTITLKKDIGASAFPTDKNDATKRTPFIFSGTNTILDMGGHTIDRGLAGKTAVDNGNVITVDSGSLTVKGNGVITGGKSTSSGGGVVVNASATFTLINGTISGNNSYNNGGGVYNGGTFNMSGGTISGNHSDTSGGGVFDGGTFNMFGGTISGNDSIFGGGVYNVETFNMSGGTISENNSIYGGGGVYVYYTGTFNISGSPVIYGNSNGSGKTANNVYLDKSTIGVTGALDNGALVGIVNTLTGKATEMTVAQGEGYVLDAVDVPAFLADDAECYTYYEGGVIKLSRGSQKIQARWGVADANGDAPTKWENYDGGTLAQALEYANGTTLTSEQTAYIQLLSHVKTTETQEFTRPAVLDLNGYTIDGSGITEASKASVITVNITEPGAALTIKDSGTTGRITGGKGTSGNGGGVNVSSGDLVLKGGTISGNSASFGGGVYVDNDTFTMDGGTITGNTATEGGGVFFNGDTFNMKGGSITGNSAGINGGGVYVYSGTFDMNGGTISDNSVTNSGGGVYVEGGAFNMYEGTITDNTAKYGGGVHVASGTFTMNEGTISDNTAVYGGGGGVYVFYGTFTMNEGAISGNTAAQGGGGVYLNSGTFTMSGGAISGNTATTNGGGVYVAYGAFTMSGGTISGNSATTGGGVYNNYGTFNISGGTISGNTATTAVDACGGGVYVNSGTFNISGTPVIKNNAGSNVYLLSGRTITVTGTLNDGAYVGVTAFNGTEGTIVAKGGKLNTESTDPDYDIKEADAKKFVPDDANLVAALDDPNNAIKLEQAGDQVKYSIGTNEPTDWDSIPDTTLADAVTAANAESGTTATTTFIRFLTNVTTGAPLVFSNTAHSVSLDLNGYTLDRGLGAQHATTGGNVITVKTKSAGTHVTVKNGTVTGGNNIGDGGGIRVESGALILDSVTITDNRVDKEHVGGGVYVSQNATSSITAKNTVKVIGNYKGSANDFMDSNVYLSKWKGIALYTLNGDSRIGVSLPDERNANVICVTDGDSKSGCFTSDDGGMVEEVGAINDVKLVNIYAPVSWTTDNSAFKFGTIQGAVKAANKNGKTSTTQITVNDNVPTSLRIIEPLVFDNCTATLTLGKSIDRGLANKSAEYDGNVITLKNGAEITLNTDSSARAIKGGNATDDGMGGGITVEGGSTLSVGGKLTITGNKADGKKNNVYLADRKDDDVKENTIAINSDIALDTVSRIGISVPVSPENITRAITVVSSGATDASKKMFVPDVGGFDERVRTQNGKGILEYYVGARWGEASGVAKDAEPAEWIDYGSIEEAVAYANKHANTYVKLVSDAYVAKAQVFTGKNTVLDLAGKKIDRGLTVDTATKGGNVITVAKKASLTLKDGVITGGSNNDEGGGVIVKGTLNMSSGAISGNSSKNDCGGGVYVDGGTFTMKDGTIGGDEDAEKNTATDGGGVYVANSGTFNMTGGTISGNAATVAVGGGVFVSGGTFTMEDGEISGNSATGGGGVYVIKGTFNMTGGTIGGDVVAKKNTAIYGGGVYVANGSKLTPSLFNMTGGTISGNSATDGGGVYVAYSSTFNITGGTISGNEVKNGGGVYVDGGGTFDMSGGMIGGDDDAEKNTATNGGGVYVYGGGTFNMSGTANVSGNDAADGGGVYVANSGEFNMTGGMISGNEAKAINGSGGSGGGVYVANGSTLTPGLFNMTGGMISGNSAITDIKNVGGTGGGVYVSGTFILNNGTISGNTATRSGGGVFSTGTFTMKGGEILNNIATENGGGGVDSNGTFDMRGGAISGNIAGTEGGGVSINYSVGGKFTMSNDASISNNEAVSGGGVYIKGSTFTMSGSASVSGNVATGDGGGVFVSVELTQIEFNQNKWDYNIGEFNMNGGTVTGNEATGANGGGVYVDWQTDKGVSGAAVFKMTNGEISGNEAANGGGVYIDKDAVFLVSGAPFVRNNSDNNVYLPETMFINVTGALTGGEVYVTAENGADGTKIAQGGAHVLEATDAAKFKSDDTSLEVGFVADATPYARLQTPYIPPAPYTPSAPDKSVVTIDYRAEIVTFESAYEMSGDAEDLTKAILSGGSITDYIGASVYVRVKETSYSYPSPWTTIELPARPAIPQAPEVLKFTHESATLVAVESQEYRIAETGAWQASGEFVGLQPETEYKFVTRVAATVSSFASLESEATIVTTKPEPVPPTITTETLPDANVESAYKATLTATGDLPMTWSLSLGALPEGLSLDVDTGVISGTPAIEQTATFTVMAENLGGTDEKELSITVKAKKAPVVLVSPDGDETQCETLAQALKLAKPGDTIMLNAAQTLTGNLTVPNGVTLNLNGNALICKKLIVKKNAVLVASAGQAIEVSPGKSQGAIANVSRFTGIEINGTLDTSGVLTLINVKNEGSGTIDVKAGAVTLGGKAALGNVKLAKGIVITLDSSFSASKKTAKVYLPADCYKVGYKVVAFAGDKNPGNFTLGNAPDKSWKIDVDGLLTDVVEKDPILIPEYLVIGNGQRTNVITLLTWKYKGAVTWQSSDENVFEITKSGKKRFIKGVAEGSAELTATFADASVRTIPVSVVPLDSAVKKVVAPDEVKLKRGETRKLSPTIKPATASDDTLFYNSSDESVATVEEGVITAVAPGTCRVLIVSTSGKRAVVKVTVGKPAIASASLEPTSLTLKVGEAFTLKAFVTPADADKKVSWKSKDTAIAVVKAGKVTAKKVGKTVIICEFANGTKLKCDVEVVKG